MSKHFVTCLKLHFRSILHLWIPKKKCIGVWFDKVQLKSNQASKCLEHYFEAYYVLKMYPVDSYVQLQLIHE